MKFHRIDNPPSIDESQIKGLLDSGAEVILQFSKADAYNEKTLSTLNRMCERFSALLNIRFYGHYGSEFDARILRHLPAVRSLNIDCLTNAIHLNSLDYLACLEEFAFGVFEANIPHLLESNALTHLRKLTLASTRKSNIDLASLKSYLQLEELFISGHSSNIDAIANLPRLLKLSLSGMGKTKGLSFIQSITPLKTLRYILGGRLDVRDLAHDALERLEIVRVLGLSEIDLTMFPKLGCLIVEDQLRLEQLNISSLRHLEELSIANCKRLIHLVGLSSVGSLESLRITRTALDLNELLDHIPTSLKALTLHSSRKAIDYEVQLRVASMGLPSAYYTGGS